MERWADPETDLLAIQAQGGDREAQEALLTRFTWLLRCPRGPDGRRLRPRPPLVDVGDLRQDAARHFLDLLGEYRPELGISFGAYVWRKLPWRMMNGLRTLTDRVPAVSLDGAVLQEAEGELAVELMRSWEVDGEVALHDALAGLSLRQRQVIAFLYVQDLDTSQAAARLGLTRRAVNGLRQRAEDRLRRRLRRCSCQGKARPGR